MRILKDEHLEKTVVLTISAQDMIHGVREWLLEHSHVVKKPGFRQGKLPLPLLFKEKGLQAMGAVVERQVSAHVSNVVGDRQAAGPLNYRILTDLNAASVENMPDVEVEVTAIFSPQVPDVQWTDVHVTQWKVVPSEQDVETALQDKAKRARKTVALTDKRPARHGDVLVYTMQYTCSDGTSQETEGAMTLGSGLLPAEFEESLVGIEEGHVVTERLRVPKGFPQNDLVGKKVLFAITFKEIKETVPHDCDEEFATSQGYESLDAMRKAVETELQESGEVLSGVLMRRDIKEQLGGIAEFEVPHSWVHPLAVSLSSGTADSENPTPEVMDKARSMVRAETVVRHVVQSEKFKAQDSELMAYMQVIAQQQRKTLDQVVNFFRNNHRAARAMTDEILERKALNWIGERCTKTEQTASWQEVYDRLHHKDALRNDLESSAIISCDGSDHTHEHDESCGIGGAHS